MSRKTRPGDAITASIFASPPVVLRGLLVRGAPDGLSPRGDRVVGGLAGVTVVGRLGEVVPTWELAGVEG